MPRLHEHGVDVTFKMVDGDKRFAQPKGERLAVQDADQEGAGEARPFGDRDGVKLRKRDACLGHSRAHHRHDVAQMLARSQLRHHAAEVAMERDLRSHHV